MQYVTDLGPASTGDKVRAFWAPGCSSCLRMKEFLKKHGVEFESVNVIEQPDELAALAKFGIKSIPIAMRGDRWANGAILADVAKVAGINAKGTEILPPAELMNRLNRFLDIAMTFARALPAEALEVELPGRPRSYRQLACHISQIPTVWLDMVEHGTPMKPDSFNRKLYDHVQTRDQVLKYSTANRQRLNDWWTKNGEKLDYKGKADVHSGDQTLHQFFERTCWHSGQHTRQFQQVMDSLKLNPPDRVTPADIAGLPMPENIYDDNIKIM